MMRTDWLQVTVMMLGESLCLLVFLLARPHPHPHQQEKSGPPPPPLLLLPPALCDLLVSSLTLLGLYLTSAHQYQMLRGQQEDDNQHTDISLWRGKEFRGKFPFFG